MTGGEAVPWTGERVDRDGTVDDRCEGLLRQPPPPQAPARPESHMSRGLVGPSRQAPSDELGCLAPSRPVEQAAHRGYERQIIFHS
jgi:hypothetical protein